VFLPRGNLQETWKDAARPKVDQPVEAIFEKHGFPLASFESPAKLQENYRVSSFFFLFLVFFLVLIHILFFFFPNAVLESIHLSILCF
jgi:hypothetical protein